MREQAKEAALALQSPATDGSGETTAAAVTSWAALLEPTGLFDAVLRAVKAAVSEEGITELVVLGVGCFSSSPAARLQMALALLLRQRLVAPQTLAEGEASPRCWCHDPFLSSAERAACALLGFSVPTDQPQGDAGGGESWRFGWLDASPRPGRRQGGVLLFMPHCPYKLYASVLHAAWGTEAEEGGSVLSRLLMLGNSLSSYSLRSLQPSLPPTLDSVVLLEGCRREEPITSSTSAVLCLPPSPSLPSLAMSAVKTAEDKEAGAGAEAEAGGEPLPQPAHRDIAPHLDAAFNDLSLHRWVATAFPPLTARPCEEVIAAALLSNSSSSSEF
jgi:hypothetical protein